MKMLKYSRLSVHVCREEREPEPEYAPFYKGIFHVLITHLLPITFIPHFDRTAENWLPILPDDVDIVHSCNQARLFTAALADYAITPDEALAGQTETFCISKGSVSFASLPKKVESETTIFLNNDNTELTGILFYVTSEQFAHFSQELLEIEQHTFWPNQYIALSKVKEFECIKFIFANIAPIEEKIRVENERQVRSIFGMPERNKIVSTNKAELVAA
jgi:hypothetical protein